MSLRYEQATQAKSMAFEGVSLFIYAKISVVYILLKTYTELHHE